MDRTLRQKLKIARRVANIFQIIPYIRMIALCNSVACGTPTCQSDIDLLIIAKGNHIFTVRYMAVLLQTVLGLKPYPEKKQFANRLSLSFFLGTNSLNLDRISKNKREEKLRVEWISNIVPLFDENHTYLDFIDKNSWIKKYQQSYYLTMSRKSKNIKNSITMYTLRKLQEFILFFGIGWIIEKIVRSIQINRLLRLKHSHFGRERITINDQIIKLHFHEREDNRILY